MKIALNVIEKGERAFDEIKVLRYFEFRGHKFAVHHPWRSICLGRFIVSHYQTGCSVYTGPCLTIKGAIEESIEMMSRVDEESFFKAIDAADIINN